MQSELLVQAIMEAGGANVDGGVQTSELKRLIRSWATATNGPRVDPANAAEASLLQTAARAVIVRRDREADGG